MGAAKEHAEVYDFAKAALGAINRAKTQAGGTVGRHVASLTLQAPKKAFDLLAKAQSDILSATRVLDLRTTAVEGEFDPASLVHSIELAPVPEKA